MPLPLGRPWRLWLQSPDCAMASVSQNPVYHLLWDAAEFPSQRKPLLTVRTGEEIMEGEDPKLMAIKAVLYLTLGAEILNAPWGNARSFLVILHHTRKNCWRSRYRDTLRQQDLIVLIRSSSDVTFSFVSKLPHLNGCGGPCPLNLLRQDHSSRTCTLASSLRRSETCGCR
jgi:hypothetical protein